MEQDITTDKQEPKLFYLNPAQALALKPGCKYNTDVMGRGTGKGTIQGITAQRVVTEMPGAHIGFPSANIKRAMTNTLPSLLECWERLGWKRGVHYVVGIQPDKSLREWWKKPATATSNYENYVTTYTGAQICIISQDRQGTGNGLNFDYLLIDEAKFLDYAQLKDECFMANRGHRDKFGHHPMHHGYTITCDMPSTSRGSWFLKNGEDYAKVKAQTDAICSMLMRIGRIKDAVQHGKDLEGNAITPTARAAMKREYEKLRDKIAIFRASESQLYLELPTYYNVAVLGLDFIRELKRSVPRLAYLTSVCCIRCNKVSGGFYCNLTDSHYYDAADYSSISSVNMYDNFGREVKALKCKADADIDPELPLFLSFDYNANINWMCVWQPGAPGSPYNPKACAKRWPGKWLARCIRSFFVKYENKLPELIDIFCDYYAAHRTHIAYILVDNTAKNGNYAVNDEDFAMVIQHRLESHGWNVEYCNMGKQMGQSEKYGLINAALSGQREMIPVYNSEGNEYLIPAMEGTGIRNGKKDKTTEKAAESKALQLGLVETDETSLETRTDSTDAQDQGVIYFNSQRIQEQNPNWWRNAGGNGFGGGDGGYIIT